MLLKPRQMLLCEDLYVALNLVIWLPLGFRQKLARPGVAAVTFFLRITKL